MWGLREQVIELRRALVETSLGGITIEEAIQIARKALAKE
jgi:hypothetical protein